MDEFSWHRLHREVLGQSKLHQRSAHGPDHWERVEKYGIFLVWKHGGDLELVRLFALLHDSQRRLDGYEPEHGPRAAEYAHQLNGVFYSLDTVRLQTLMRACHDHDRGRTDSCPTVGACWDADRLDLDRVGLTPDPNFMSTKTGKVLSLKRAWDRRQAVGICE